MARPFDSVTFCLSKGTVRASGLRLLCGSKPFIQQALRCENAGGGMRQAGILRRRGSLIWKR
jgi:threonine aldolase